MLRITQMAAFTAAIFMLGQAYSAPQYLVTHNQTQFEEKAFIGGTIPAPKAVEANSDSTLAWTTLNRLCYGRVVNNKCPVAIKLKTNTPYSFDLGVIYIDMNTGDITPKQLTSFNTALTVINNGEFSLVAK